MRARAGCWPRVSTRPTATLPRFSRSGTAARTAGSRASKPVGTRTRISRLRPLTLLTSQVQRRVAIAAFGPRESGHAGDGQGVYLRRLLPIGASPTYVMLWIGRAETLYIRRFRQQQADTDLDPTRDPLMRNPRSIVITGASSGIGEALALAYAGAGRRSRFDRTRRSAAGRRRRSAAAAPALA